MPLLGLAWFGLAWLVVVLSFWFGSPSGLVVLSFRVRLLYILFLDSSTSPPTSPLLCCPDTMLEKGVEAMDAAWTVDSFEASLLVFSACPAFMAVLWIARTNKY